MNKKPALRFLALACLALPLVGNSHAQAPAPAAAPQIADTEVDQKFWEATLPEGEFVVALDRIVSVSRHKYALDGLVIVDEVTVDTNGQALARFYFISPISLPDSAGAALTNRGTEILGELGARSGTNIANMVVKKYPDTTHSKSIEYRLQSAEQLDQLFTSAKTAWQRGRGRSFSVR